MRRTRALAGMAVAFVLGWATVGWACIPQANLVSLQPRSFGAPGTDVTVGGLGFDETAVEIRWDGPEGTLLAKTQGPNFSVPVTVPDGPEGLHSIVVLNRDPGGGVGSASSAPFQVVNETAGQTATAAPTAAPGGRQVSSRSSEVSPLALVLAGAGLVAFGAVAGARVGRRRPPAPVSTM